MPLPLGVSPVAIGLALLAMQAAVRGDGDGDSRKSWFKVDRYRQVIRLMWRLRLSLIANAAPNARVQRGRGRPHQ
jgi:hypothetical protein